MTHAFKKVAGSAALIALTAFMAACSRGPSEAEFAAAVHQGRRDGRQQDAAPGNGIQRRDRLPMCGEGSRGLLVGGRTAVDDPEHAGQEAGIAGRHRKDGRGRSDGCHECRARTLQEVRWPWALGGREHETLDLLRGTHIRLCRRDSCPGKTRSEADEEFRRHLHGRLRQQRVAQGDGVRRQPRVPAWRQARRRGEGATAVIVLREQSAAQFHDGARQPGAWGRVVLPGLPGQGRSVPDGRR